MNPIIFIDSRLPGLEILWWPTYGLLETWLQIGQRKVFHQKTYCNSTVLDYSTAHKAAKEFFSSALEAVCDGAGRDLDTLENGWIDEYLSEHER